MCSLEGEGGGALFAAWNNIYLLLDHIPRHGNFRHALKETMSLPLHYSTRN